MTRDELVRLFRYHRWANGRILDAAAKLSPEEQTRDLKSSFPSVLATLVHLLSAEWIWLQRWKGSSPSAWPEMQSMTSVETVRRRWSEIEAEQKAWIESRTEADLSAPIAYRSMKGDPFTNPLGDLAQHVINHATYHRGQVTTMLRQLGHAPQPTDFVQFLRE